MRERTFAVSRDVVENLHPTTGFSQDHLCFKPMMDRFSWYFPDGLHEWIVSGSNSHPGNRRAGRKDGQWVLGFKDLAMSSGFKFGLMSFPDCPDTVHPDWRNASLDALRKKAFWSACWYANREVFDSPESSEELDVRWPNVSTRGECEIIRRDVTRGGVPEDIVVRPIDWKEKEDVRLVTQYSTALLPSGSLEIVPDCIRVDGVDILPNITPRPIDFQWFSDRVEMSFSTSFDRVIERIIGDLNLPEPIRQELLFEAL